MKRSFCRNLLLVTAVIMLAVGTAFAQRTELSFPDIEGYVTLACDLHSHTVFSDGSVWPSMRVDEAWRDGLDVLAITDHIEYLPHKDDIIINFNRPYEIAKPEADEQHIVLIRGAEITRDEPHGHFNAIFLDDPKALDVENEKDAVRIANEQGAFVWWNHPEWKRKGDTAWSDIQAEYIKLGWMQGMEVFNGGDYYPSAHKWCLEHKLTMLANTDIHGPVSDYYNAAAGNHRAMTLVFAQNNSPEAIEEALRARRTAAFSRNVLVGETQWVAPLFKQSIAVQHPDVALKNKTVFYVGIHNSSPVTFNLKAKGGAPGVAFPGRVSLPAGKTALLRLEGSGITESGTRAVQLPYEVENIWIAPDQFLPVTIDLNVTFQAEG